MNVLDVKKKAQCYSCKREGKYLNKGTPFRFCDRCNAIYYRNPRLRPNKYPNKIERNKANAERGRQRELKKWRITSRECYSCGTATCTIPSRPTDELWKYNLNDGKVINMLCERCYRHLYSYRRPYGHPNYRDRDRNRTLEMRWKRAVLRRDNYTCQKCGFKGISKRWRHVYPKDEDHKYTRYSTNLYRLGVGAHHILSYANYPLFRFDVNNGITLCKECHKKEHY